MSTQRLSLGVALCLLALRVPGLAQTSSAQSAQPTFRSAVDLLTIEASVRDKSGPVPDLQALDFAVTIDGRPRKVVSVVFFKADGPAGGRITGGAAPTPRHVTNDPAQPGRVIVFVLDAESIRSGEERPLIETAARMLDGLSPGDAVGLIEIPGPSQEVTRDRARVAEALRQFIGRAPREAEGTGMGKTREIVDTAHSRRVLMALAKLLRGMETVRAPRSVVLISGGLEGFHFSNMSLRSEYAELQRAAAESRVALYTVLLESVGYDMSRGEARADVAVDPAKGDGLATISSMTGGMFFFGVARAVGVFDRIRSEVTSFYQLGLESSPADADGKEHDVNVKVSRAGLDVRAPAHVAVAKPSKAVPRDPLLVALRQPTDVPDVPLAVTTYSTHAAGGAVQLLVSAEVGGPNGAAPAEWGLVITQHGKDVAIRRGRFPAGSERPRVVSTTVEVAPGDYRLRLAGVDAEDRIGVLEVPFTAGYQTAAGTVLSDLVVGVVAGGELEPRRSIARSEEVTAMLQVMAGAGATPGGSLQLVPAGSARSALTIPFSMRPAASAGLPAILQARASLTAVPPGRYTASAAVEMGGQPLTRISRIIEVTGPLPVTPPTEVVAVPVSEVAAATAPPPAPVTAPATASTGSPDEIMRRAGAYVEHYGGQASLLVAVEHYSQSLNRPPVPMPGAPVGMRGLAGNAAVDGVEFGTTNAQKRRLVSEFALVSNASASGGWLDFRDDRGGRQAGR